MHDALAASIFHALLGLELGATRQEAGNRFSIEGLTVGANADRALQTRITKLAAASLRLACGPFTLEVSSLALHQVVAQVRMDQGRPRLLCLDASTAELSGVTVHGPLALPRQPKAAPAGVPLAAWSLAPLAAADGTIRAQIVDAQLLFDAEVTVPIRQGTIDFQDATVEHVGPDSRLGVSRLGLYVDAPNGRGYLYQFASAPVAGVEYERRGAVLGPWVTHRGSLRLQDFGESMLRQGRATPGAGFSEQSRLLLARTAVSGDVQLGDGRLSAPGVRGDLVGRAAGRNAVRLHSEAVGRGLTVEMISLSVRQAAWNTAHMELDCDEITAALSLRFFAEGTQLRFALSLENMKISGLRLRPARPEG